jgi:anaphase-promoting complex subunit 6
MSEDVSDAFWLAHIYFHIQAYARAHALLTKQSYLESSYDCRYLAALCLVRDICDKLIEGETVKMGGSA